MIVIYKRVIKELSIIYIIASARNGYLVTFNWSLVTGRLLTFALFLLQPLDLTTELFACTAAMLQKKRLVKSSSQMSYFRSMIILVGPTDGHSNSKERFADNNRHDKQEWQILIPYEFMNLSLSVGRSVSRVGRS